MKWAICGRCDTADQVRDPRHPRCRVCDPEHPSNPYVRQLQWELDKLTNLVERRAA